MLEGMLKADWRHSFILGGMLAGICGAHLHVSAPHTHALSLSLLLRWANANSYRHHVISVVELVAAHGDDVLDRDLQGIELAIAGIVDVGYQHDLFTR